MELPPAPEGSRLPSGPALLVVDDDRYVRATITRALAYEGYELLEAADGLQALALLQEEGAGGVRLVITDIRMPGMNGDDLGRLLRELRPDLPVLYISGYSVPNLDFLAPGELQRCWLAKPFTPSRLLARVRELLRGGLVAT
jgi:two-component system, cell cycle sensor histidine kinase and response regulator CckA